MKKRIIKKTLRVALLISVITLTGYKLYRNKSQTDQELENLMSYEQLVPVRVTTAQSSDIEYLMEETGVFCSCQEIDLVSETHGLILKMFVKTGDHVSLGDTLAIVEKKLVEQQLALAELNLHHAKEDLKRFESLSSSEAVTIQQYEQVKLAYQNSLNQVAIQREQLENTCITAPFDGYISTRSIDPGSYISPGMQLMKIARQKDLLLETFLDGTSLERIKEGRKVQVIPSAGTTGPIEGKVHEVAIKSSQSGRYRVTIKVHNSSLGIKQGMSGKVIFRDCDKERGIVLPRKCIINSILDPSIYVLNGNEVIIRNITVSPLNETQILVKEGLQDGELVVLSGHMNLSSDTQVRIID